MAVAVAALAALSAAVAGPALATGESGTAVGAGPESIDTDPPSGLPVCLHVNSSSYSFALLGTVTGGNGASVYAATQSGQLNITLSASDYYINPGGVFSDSSCTSPGTKATITLSGSDGTGGVSSCSSGSGSASYIRVNTHVVFQGTFDCTVTGNVAGHTGTSSAGADTMHTFAGNLTPCSPLGDPVTCNPVQMQGVYTEI